MTETSPATAEPAHLFSPLAIREVKFRNRIGVSPMCEYSSAAGFANDWHLVHLGSRAVGGAAIVMTEAAAVLDSGRISPRDLGIWLDDHILMLSRIFRFIEEQGAVPAMQLAHAGRKASTAAPWDGGGAVDSSNGGWSRIFAPSAIPFSAASITPDPLDEHGISWIVEAFADAARRAREAGAKIIEIHSAHGYLLHEFLSPLSNKRTDCYGGSFENRTRFLREVVHAVRQTWPAGLPLFVRISATDWVDGGWTTQESVCLAKQLQTLGVDLIDCSSGGAVPNITIPAGPGYQVPFAEQIRKEAGVATAAVGMITRARAGRYHCAYREGRHGVSRTRALTRSLLAAARVRSVAPQRPVAETVFAGEARVTPRLRPIRISVYIQSDHAPPSRSPTARFPRSV